MKVLVTGANGFIGRALCRHLVDEGMSVRGLVRPGSTLGTLTDIPAVEVTHGDVLSTESLSRALEGADAVVHLAGAVAAGRDSTYARVNVEGTRNLSEAAKAAGVRRAVFMSSLAAQGPSQPGQPHRTAGNEQPLNSYGRSKLEAETILRELLGDAATILRPGIAYGPDYADLAQVARWVRSRVVPFVPDLELSFVHVDDLVALVGLALRAEGAAVGPYFVSDGEVQRMERVVDRLESLVSERPGLRLPLSAKVLGWLEPVTQRVADTAGLGASISRLIAEVRAPGWACVPDEAVARFGFAVRHPLDTALPEVMSWYRDRGWFDTPARTGSAAGQTSNT